ncbi:MAG: hypothetical protein J6D37_06680 [Clostridia bacterium]|nr:hypothetical protein [Clostridia bacterium]
MCDRLSANKQTIAAIVGRIFKKGYIVFEEVAEDRRNKRIFFTERGKACANGIFYLRWKRIVVL